MCRHIAWLGPPRRLSELLLEHEHGLIVHLVDVADGVVTVTELEA